MFVRHFGLFCSFSPKLPRIHVGLHCNANNREKGYARGVVLGVNLGWLLIRKCSPILGSFVLLSQNEQFWLFLALNSRTIRVSLEGKK